jgi:lipid A disaccharide synthetase
VPELLQADCTPGRIAAAAEPLLSATPGRAAQLDALRAVRAQLLPQGSARATRRVAEEVLALVEGP